jgi:hypothetical protein
MLEVPADLPPGALCDGAEAILADDLADGGGLWWAGAGLTAARDGSVTAWAPRIGTRNAMPTPPAAGNGTIGEAGGLRGLRCRAGLHCGLTVAEAAPEARRATLGVRYLAAPGDDTKTLLTLNATDAAQPGEKNYLFLSETGGRVLAQDNLGQVTLTADLPTGAADLRMLLVGVGPAGLCLEILGQAPVRTPAPDPLLNGPAQLFIGCRNARKGLTKTLGAALITDVWLWPDRDLWVEAPRTLCALRRFHLWTTPEIGP